MINWVIYNLKSVFFSLKACTFVFVITFVHKLYNKKPDIITLKKKL